MASVALEQAGATSRQTARQALSGPCSRPQALYIHVPFCSHKCHYCDFYSFVDTRDQQAAFVDALTRELAAQAAAISAGGARPPLRTIFVGGGTPSLLSPALWERALAALHEAFDCSAITRGEPGCEFTVECNPESASPELMRVLRAGGVDRVSVGAQSFSDPHLKTLERTHDPRNVPRALAHAAEAGIRRRSVDLIYGIPGQTMEEWRSDVERALALEPAIEHLSCYALTYEPNTAMTARLKRGEFTPCDEDLEASMYEWLVDRVRDAGFERYEVSNFARAPGTLGDPGAAGSGKETRSLHNLAYWRQDSWLACGPSASGHIALPPPAQGGWRWKNVPRLGEWMESVQAGGGWSAVVDLEPPDARRALAERIMMGLRISEGLDEAALGRDAEALGAGAPLREAIARQQSAGRLRASGGRLALTDAGYLFADAVARDLMRPLRGVSSASRPSP